MSEIARTNTEESSVPGSVELLTRGQDRCGDIGDIVPASAIVLTQVENTAIVSGPWTEDENETLRAAYARRGESGWFWKMARALHRGSKEIADQADKLGVARKVSAMPRPHLVRARSLPYGGRFTREERSELVDYPEGVDRPKTRSDCLNGERPCPFVSCPHHLYLDVNPCTGSIKLNFPDLEVEQMTETCVLDVADRGGITLEEVGVILNLTRERVRQIEVAGLVKLRKVRAGQ